MAPKTKDYYQLLGIARDCSPEEVKRAYRKLAIKHHPDKNPGDKASEEAFKEISEAYEVLSDSDKRQAYDRFGYEGVKGSFRGGGFSWEDFHHADEFQDVFGDLFGSLFGMGGGGRGRSERRRGRDLRVRLDISLDDVLFGRETEITLKRLEPCVTCGGQGVKPGSKVQVCQRCGGAGQIRISQGFFQLTTTCDVCRGEGRIIKDPCVDCQGQGRTSARVKLKIRVPRGVQTGTQLRLQGEGEAGPAGADRGDLYVVLNVEEAGEYERDGYDIHRQHEISFSQAALGDELKVETPWGPYQFRLPAATQPGQRFKISNHGIPRSDEEGAPRGHLYLHVKIRVPKKLSDRQRQLLREFAQEEGETITEEDKGFFGKMKDSLEEIIGTKRDE